MSVCLLVYMNTYEYGNVCAYVYIHVYMYLYVYTCVCTQENAHVYRYIHLVIRNAVFRPLAKNRILLISGQKHKLINEI